MTPVVVDVEWWELGTDELPALTEGFCPRCRQPLAPCDEQPCTIWDDASPLRMHARCRLCFIVYVRTDGWFETTHEAVCRAMGEAGVAPMATTDEVRIRLPLVDQHAGLQWQRG